jgi:hypothetical protein
MKSVKSLVVLSAMVAAITMFFGCASNKGPIGSDGKIALESEASVITIEHKGTGVGMNPPAWFAVYFDKQIAGLQALPEYKNTYCFVGLATMSGQTAATTWATRFEVQQQIGQMISTGVASVFKANESMVPDNEDARRAYSNAINTLSLAEYSGAQPQGDWWIKQRHGAVANQDEYIDYTAYVFYTIDKPRLDEQIKTQLDRLSQGNPALSAAFNAVASDILVRGTEWTVEKN